MLLGLPWIRLVNSFLESETSPHELKYSNWCNILSKYMFCHFNACIQKDRLLTQSP